MIIKDNSDLSKTVDEVNERLQAIQEYCGNEKRDDARVIFPRGFLRSAAFHRNTLPTNLPPLLTHNISYSLMTLDVLRWLIIRTDLSGAGKSMIIKRAIAILAEIIEALVKHFSKRKKFDAAINYLAKENVFNDELAKNLKKVWQFRSTIHLWEAKVLEHDKFKTSDYNTTLAIYDQMRKSLIKYSAPSK